MPVVDVDGTLIGIVTRADLFAHSSEPTGSWPTKFEHARAAEGALDTSGNVNVALKEGVVTLTRRGRESADGRLCCLSLSRRLPGVVAVRSDVTWEDENGRPSRRRRPRPIFTQLRVRIVRLPGRETSGRARDRRRSRRGASRAPGSAPPTRSWLPAASRQQCDVRSDGGRDDDGEDQHDPDHARSQPTRRGCRSSRRRP